MVKLHYAYTIISTSNINHTGLYNEAEKIDRTFAKNFKQIFFHSDPDRSKTSREYDEVIIRSLAVLGLGVNFIDKKSRRSEERFAVIYYKFVNEEDETKAIKLVKNIGDKYQRKPVSIEVKVATKLPNSL